jgi:hypothetical protein
MAAIIKPSDVPKYVPGAVTAASDDLGWNGVWLRGYRYTALDVIVPPVTDFTIVSYCRGSTFMERRYEGAWTKTHCTPGDISLLTRSRRSHGQAVGDLADDDDGGGGAVPAHPDGQAAAIAERCAEGLRRGRRLVNPAQCPFRSECSVLTGRVGTERFHNV